MKNSFGFLLVAGVVVCVCALAAPPPARSVLEKEFVNPPAAFKPWIFYFFESRFMDPKGITADLEALAAAGIGGMVVFSEHREGMPEGPVRMFSDEYAAGMRHLFHEADRLGLLVSLQNCPGSATAGGPWNAPEHSMKQVVWSETYVQGGGSRTIKLPQPFTVMGFYRDVAVVAYPVPSGARPANLPHPNITAPGAEGLGAMTDGDILTTTLFRGGGPFRKKREIRLAYDQPYTVGRLYVYGNQFKYRYPLDFELESSNDGTHWTRVTTAVQHGNNPTVTDFTPVTARHFRVWVVTREDSVWISEIELLPSGVSPRAFPRFNDWAAATGRKGGDYGSFQPIPIATNAVLDASQAVDLHGRMSANGTLVWDVPAGVWLVLRIGYTTTGKTNHPAKDEGRGLEVDKLNAAHVRRHAEEALRKMTGCEDVPRGLRMFSVDSWEADGQNWSENLASAFERANGYSLYPFLPVLCAHLVDGPEPTRRFLRDFRGTLRELVSDAFYGSMGAFARDKGLAFLAESSAAPVPIHRPLDYFKYVDIPGGEAWSHGDFRAEGNISGGLRDAISAAHILGRERTMIEVFTSNVGNWNMSPRFLKPFGDKVLSAGANQLTLHCYIHQPSPDLMPGWTMNRYGTTFNRHVTWWPYVAPWMTSITRSQYLLRQGRSVVDVCRVIGDDDPIVPADGDRTGPFWDAPDGYANDWMLWDNLTSGFRVENATWISASNTARYRLLVLPDGQAMPLTALRVLQTLVEAGGVVLGSRPTSRAGLQGGVAVDREFDRRVTALWGTPAEPVRPQEIRVGRGCVLTGMSLQEALKRRDVSPDLVWMPADTNTVIHWHHRCDGDRDIYFLANGKGVAARTTFSFRVDRKAPTLFFPETGAVRQPALFRFAGQRVEMPLNLAPYESIFVVFGPEDAAPRFERVRRDGVLMTADEPSLVTWLLKDGMIVMEADRAGEYTFEGAQGEQVVARMAAPPPPLPVQGPWQVRFQGVSAPDPQTFEKLWAWNMHPNNDVRFFSGTGEYRTTFEADAAMVAGDVVAWLDLGEVRELAEVQINGAALGLVWKTPYRINITGYLKAGVNELVIRAVNTWANRLIGDATLSESARKTWTSFKHYSGKEALPPSGLLGPVQIKYARRLSIAP